MKIIESDPFNSDATFIIGELSKELMNITGDDGTHSFQPMDFCEPRSIFIIAYDEDGNAIGCGGIRSIDGETAEVKRMFALKKSNGVGSEILGFLEKWAKEEGYTRIWLETRLINQRAVRFYGKMGYSRIENYGKYSGNPEAVCFEKLLRLS